MTTPLDSGLRNSGGDPFQVSTIPRSPNPHSHKHGESGRFFKMEFSPLRNNRQTLGISSAGGPRRSTIHGLGGRDTNAHSPHVASAASMGAVTAQKMKSLEEFLETYPVESSKNQKLQLHDGPNTMVDDDIPTLTSTMKKGKTVSSGAGGITIGGATGAVLTKEAQARKQKVDTWVNIAEKGNSKLRLENELLERLALITQENCLDNDAKFEEAVSQLRSELEFAEIFRQDTSETVRNVEERITGIRQLIGELVTTAERTSQQEHEAVRSAFQRQLEGQRAELERVRESGKNTTSEWKQRNVTLQAELEAMLHETQTTYEKLSALQTESQRLRVEFSAQAGDTELLETEYRRVYTQHQRLKDRLHSLELDLANRPLRAETLVNSNAAVGGMVSRSVASLEGELVAASEQARNQANQAGGSFSDRAKEDNDYQVALKRAQIMFETEASNLSAVREAHLQTLKQRTELEVYLRQQILHQKMIKLRQREADTSAGAAADDQNAKEACRVTCVIEGGAPVAFMLDDRKSVVERLLTIERVLQLLFEEETSGSRTPIAAGGAVGGAACSSNASIQSGGERSLSTSRVSGHLMRLVDDVAKPSVKEHRELSALYDRWQQWTSKVNEEIFDVKAPPQQSAQ